MSDVTENQPAAQSTASAPGEPALNVSVPVQPAASGSTDIPTATPSTAQISTQTATEAATPPVTGGEPGNANGVVDASTAVVAVAPASPAPVGEQGNVSAANAAPTAASADSATSATSSTETTSSASTEAVSEDSQSASDAAPSSSEPSTSSASFAGDPNPAPTSDRAVVISTPQTDTQVSSPTGGPIAGRGDTAEAKAKHGVLDRIEEDLRAELHAIEGLPHYVLHIMSAVFDRHHTHVDNSTQ